MKASRNRQKAPVRRTEILSSNKGDVRPPLKWAGSKYRILDRIRQLLPPGTRLIEPFVGSGAVFLNTDYTRYIINDRNQDLIDFYSALKTQGTAFVEYCRKLFVPINNDPTRYYDFRNEFNLATDPKRKSTIFLYLNKHGYNGLCRYNASGEFNVPFGRYKNPYFPEKELIRTIEKLSKATITCFDFERVMRTARTDDVIYCDPPYVPLSKTSYFTSYSAGGFSDADQKRLAKCAEDVRKKGVTVLISNHKTSATEKIYSNANRLVGLSVRRLISCNSEKRELASELLALYMPRKRIANRWR